MDLVWEAPAACPTKDDVLARIGEILGSGSASSAHVTARGTLIRVAESSFQLELETRTGDVTNVRTIEAVSCASLAKAAAIIITTALAEAPAETRPVKPPRAPRPRAAARSRPPPSARPPDPLAFAMNVAATFDVGTLPEVASGMSLAVAADYRWVRAGVTGAAYFPQHVTFAPSEATGRFRMYTAGAYGCALFAWWRVRAGPCAELGVGLVDVVGVGLPNARAVSLVAPEAAGAAFASLCFTRYLHAFVRFEAVWAFHEQVVGLRSASGDVVLHEVALPAARGALGFEARFP